MRYCPYSIKLNKHHQGNHMANERTLLAWVRTALAMVGLGAALTKIDELTGGIAAIVFIAMGLFCMILGTHRYYRVKNALLKYDQREYEINHTALVRMGLKPFVVATVVLLFLLGSWFLYKIITVVV